MRPAHVQLLVALLLLGSGLARVPVAEAQSRMAVPQQRRPLTLPRGTLRPSVGAVHTHDTRHRFHVVAGLGAGVNSDFELGALLVPLMLAPDARYGSAARGMPAVLTSWYEDNRPMVYGRYRFLDGDVEIGLDVHFVLPVPEPFHVIAGVPFLFHISDLFRIDTGFYLEVEQFDDAHGFLPFAFTVQATPRFFIGVESGFRVRGPDVPLGVLLGYTAGSPIVDLKGGFRFLDVEMGTRDWQIWFEASFYIFL